MHAFELTAIVAGIAVALNMVFGVGVALLLARYRFPGRRLLNVLIDLPVSVSPIVVGLALILVYGPTNGWFGVGAAPTPASTSSSRRPAWCWRPSSSRCRWSCASWCPSSRKRAWTKRSRPARSGRARAQRFWRITLPTIRWALAYGVVLSIARSIGEYGAIKVVSGNVIGQTQTVTLLVDERASQFEPGAYQAAMVLVVVAVACMVAVSLIRPKENG